MNGDVGCNPVAAVSDQGSSGPSENDSESMVPVDLNLGSLIDDAKSSETCSQVETLNERSIGLWKKTTLMIHRIILGVLHPISQLAVRNPWTTISTTTLISVFLVVTGLLTNFRIEADEFELWTIFSSVGPSNSAYLTKVSRDQAKDRVYQMYAILHADGESVLDPKAVEHAFDIQATIETTPAYTSFCNTTVSSCGLTSVTSFWSNNRTLFEASVESQEDLVNDLSTSPPERFRTPLGKPTVTSDGRLESLASLVTIVEVAQSDRGREVLSLVEEDLLLLRRQLELQSNGRYTLEVSSPNAFSEEFTRGLLSDIPFVPMVFGAMSLFTCIVFYQQDSVSSRCLLGLLAVLSVLLAIMSTYGLLFIIGVPLTALTQILPFVIFGVGVDDAYILSGAFLSTDRSASMSERVRAMMEEAGLSIFLTSLTSSLAFALGCLTQAPAVRWMCFYGFPGILLDFLFQITFFVACIVLDERRIESDRKDCFACTRRQKKENSLDESVPTPMNVVRRGPCLDSSAKAASHLSRMLLRPLSQMSVVSLCVGLLVACAISAASLTQAFDFTDLLPSDSYVIDFYDAYDQYTEDGAVFAGVYFRDVNQSDPIIQDQMMDFYESLGEGQNFEGIGCWVAQYRDFLDENPAYANQSIEELLTIAPELNNNFLLDSDTFIVDADGHIVVSACALRVDIPYDGTEQQIHVIQHVQDVTREQPINKGKLNGPFFAYDKTFQLYEYTAIAIDELILMTVTSVSAVGSVSLVFMPHWSAALFMFPMLGMMYIDVLGFMQWFEIPINALTSTVLAISVGLLVDYMMHILFAYMSCEGRRIERARLALESIGPSVFLGGFSTLLGVLFLGLGQTQVFETVFTMFVTIILIGMLHGLIFLPVVLSLVGPETAVNHPSRGGSNSS